MAAKYEKLDLAAFKVKLVNGDYASITGARRAIGRMTTWSEKEKSQARDAANKTFGVGTGDFNPSPKKKAKKKAVKKVVKKAAKKKVAKKMAKRSVKKVRSKQSKGSPAAAQPRGTVMERLTETNLQIQAYGQAIDHMGKTKELGCPSAQVQEGAKLAQQGLIAAVNNLCVLTKEASESSLSVGDNGAPTNKVWDTAVDATQPTLHSAIPASPDATETPSE